MIGVLGALLCLAAGGAAAQPSTLDPYPLPRAEAGGSHYEVVEPLLDLDEAAPLIFPKGPSADRTSAWEFTGNPDRYPSLQFLQSGLDTLDGHSTTLTPTGDTNRTERSYVVGDILTGLLPVSDAWTLTVGGGLNLNETDAYGTPVNNEGTADNSLAQYILGGRYYFVGVQGPWDTAENPDRWPSIGVQGSGSTTVNYDPDTGIVKPNGTVVSQPFSTKGWRVDNENRFPLSDWYTLIVTFSGLYSNAFSPYVPHLLSGSLSRSETVGGTIQQNFYFVGHNLISNDQGLNPDRWTSLYFAAGGLTSAWIKSEATTDVGTPVVDRHAKSDSVNADVGLRLPVTAHATFRLELDYVYSYSETPVFSAAFTGGRRVTTQLGATAGFRLYLF